MIPVDQIRVGYGKGQCTEASIASLLECRLEEVPDLWTGVESKPGEDFTISRKPESWQRMLNFIQDRGMFFLQVTGEKHDTVYAMWQYALSLFPEAFAELITNEYHLAGGDNIYGIGHMVVCKSGYMVHDPNPTRRFIVNCNEVNWILPRTTMVVFEQLTGESVLHLPAIGWREL